MNATRTIQQQDEVAQVVIGLCGQVSCYGWMAAMGSMIGFGSFGALIKCESARKLQIDPLVFQTYKSGMCFITSWMVLGAGFVPHGFRFSPWGIVSGFFWVPGGYATIAAVQLAGLSIGLPVGNSVIVLVSFTWGIFVFQEKVRSKVGACGGVALMVLGFIGMTYFSTRENNEPPKEQSQAEEASLNTKKDSAELELTRQLLPTTTGDLDGENEGTEEGQGDIGFGPPELRNRHGADTPKPITHSHQTTPEKAPTILSSSSAEEPIVILGKAYNRKHVGIAIAICAGLWGGSQLVPMKFVPADMKGIGFLMSFAIGASLVTLGLWVVRFLYLYQQKQYSWRAAYHALPSFHFQQMWLPGCCSGLLWSFGNLCSFVSVYHLGQGVGYSVTQAAMIVSGLWGIFYFKEIQGFSNICRWFLSAGLAVMGILVLSYEKSGG